METKIVKAEKPDCKVQVVIASKLSALKDFRLTKEMKSAVKQAFKQGETVFPLRFYEEPGSLYIINGKTDKSGYHLSEYFRRCGNELYHILKKSQEQDICVSGKDSSGKDALAIAEGLLLTSYDFDKYKSRKKDFEISQVKIYAENLKQDDISGLKAVVKSVFLARDLVNEPASYLTAEQFSSDLQMLSEKYKFRFESFNRKKIESLKMGGLLGVNQGSETPPTFNILEYSPSKPKNKKPVVLAGKGVVFDTGGLSLKSPKGMEKMKADMAGAAAVAGAFLSAVLAELPVHLIALIPATDNRPGKQALAPGDIIKMFSGTTVEVLNTDAEGRLILADALTYAKKYDPELVIDVATLTGSAARAIGKEGLVFMGNAADKEKKELCKSGDKVYERVVEFPLWEEYERQIQSSVADLKNVGGPEAGAITAGKFLENFVDYPWLHLDIAGPAFLPSAEYYKPKNGTGVGVRLLFNFLKNR